MADLRLKQNGLRFLDSRNGDILLADSRLNMQLLFTSEFLALANEDPSKMLLLGKKLFDFIERHTEARWRYIQNQVNEIKINDINFADKITSAMQPHTIDALRKCEKDIYFYSKQNAKND